MARRSDHKRTELKVMAIEAGLDIIIREGLQAFSARKITKKMGYTVGTLYNIFNNLDDLIAQINVVTLEIMVKDMMPKKPDELSPEKELIDIGCRYISFAYNNFNRWNALFLHQPPKGGKVPDVNFKYFLELHSYLLKTIHRVADFSEDEAKLHSKILWSSIHGICMLGITHRLQISSEEHLHSMATKLIKTYLVGIKKACN